MKKYSAAPVRVILLDLRGLDGTAYRMFYEAASEERRRRADRYLRQEDAVRCIMAEALVRYAYAGTGKRPDPFEIVRTPQGKPYLKQDDRFHFSISHTGSWAAAACAGEEIGMDVEQIHRPVDRRTVADAVFTPEERAWIFSPHDETVQRLRFAELWTAKESYLKYIGTGFRKSPLKVKVDPVGKRIAGTDAVLTGMVLPQDCYLTVCGRTGAAEVEFADVSVLKESL